MNRWLVAGFALAAIATAGCMKVDQTLTIKADGSAELAVSYGMSEQTITQMQAMKEMSKQAAEGGAAAEDNDPFDFDEGKIRAELAKLEKDGVEIKSLKSETKDGWKYIHMTLNIASLPALMKTEFFKDDAVTLTKNADGNYVFEQKSDGGGEDEMMNEEMMKQMLPMFAGFRAAMTIKTPTPILETNAPDKTDKSAAWIYDVDKDPAALIKAQKANMKVVFSGQGITLPEIRPAGAAQP